MVSGHRSLEGGLGPVSSRSSRGNQYCWHLGSGHEASWIGSDKFLVLSTWAGGNLFLQPWETNTSPSEYPFAILSLAHKVLQNFLLLQMSNVVCPLLCDEGSNVPSSVKLPRFSLERNDFSLLCSQHGLCSLLALAGCTGLRAPWGRDGCPHSVFPTHVMCLARGGHEQLPVEKGRKGTSASSEGGAAGNAELLERGSWACERSHPCPVWRLPFWSCSGLQACSLPGNSVCLASVPLVTPWTVDC